MTLKTITIHITDTPGGGVTVLTTAGQPIPGSPVTPAQALAMDVLTRCAHQASDVRYWGGRDRALELVNELLKPEGFGWAVHRDVHNAARRVLGIPPVKTAAGAA